MFFTKSKNKGKERDVRRKDDEIKAFLGKETEFDGKLILSGSARIDGAFSGEIWGSGTLVIGKDARVQANVSVDNIQIFGELRGELDIKNQTEISETGVFSGNLKTAMLIVREGAVFEGRSSMKSEVKGNDDSESAESSHCGVL